MELIAMSIITPFLIQLGKKGLEKMFEKGGEKVSDGAINWMKSLFLKEGQPKKALLELQLDSENIEKQNNAKAIIENSIEDNPEFENFLKEIIEKALKTESTISNSKNINTGNVNTGGGNFRIGDNNGK